MYCFLVAWFSVFQSWKAPEQNWKGAERIVSAIEQDDVSFTVLGARVQALDIGALTAIIKETIESSTRAIIANHNLHSLYLFQNDEKFRRFYESARWIQIDGMPIVWLGQVAGLPLRREHRVTYVDW